MALRPKKIQMERNPAVDPAAGPNPERPPLRPVDSPYTDDFRTDVPPEEPPIDEPIYDLRERRGPDRERESREEYRRAQENVLKGSLWMVGITIALFFLPLINGLVGGLVGGYKVGGVGRALVAAILPAVIVGLGLWLLLAVMGLPLVGIIAGVAVSGWIALTEISLFVGAAIGGAIGSGTERIQSRKRYR